MKRYIMLFAILATAFILSAQTTERGTRSSSGQPRTSPDEKKSSGVNTETRTRESAPATREATPERKSDAPVRNNTENQQRNVQQERQAPSPRVSEPASHESRNREVPPPVRQTQTRQAEPSGVQTRPSEPSRNAHVNSQGNSRQEPVRTSREVNSAEERRVAEPDRNSREYTRPNTTSRQVNTDRGREYVPRTEQVYVEKRTAYRTPERTRSVRTVSRDPNYVYHPVEYRRTYYPYAEPRRVEIIWDYDMYIEYRYLYPHFEYWYYPIGYRIHTVSAYDADRYIGEVARIYGRVSEVWYERHTDEFTLYFGGPYPYHDFSVIIPGKYARRFSRNPQWYFTDKSIAVTGLISLWDDRPEMLIRKRSQIEVYF